MWTCSARRVVLGLSWSTACTKCVLSPSSSHFLLIVACCRQSGVSKCHSISTYYSIPHSVSRRLALKFPHAHRLYQACLDTLWIPSQLRTTVFEGTSNLDLCSKFVTLASRALCWAARSPCARGARRVTVHPRRLHRSSLKSRIRFVVFGAAIFAVAAVLPRACRTST